MTFLPDDKTVEIPEGTSISDAGIAAGVNIRIPCGGGGRCGKCTVFIGEHANERVLACRTAVRDGMVVTVPAEDTGTVIAAVDDGTDSDIDLTPLSEGFGLAVDIGTTTVAISIIDLSDGHTVFTAADKNQQRSRGEDVLARIQYAEEGGTEELHALVLRTINGLIGSCHTDGFSPSRITSVYIAGNTAMTHLFLGVDPSPIRFPPYEPVVREAEISGRESGLDVNPSARVICMPSVASYVGGDITSDIVDCGIDKDIGLTLMIDVGTNGEVAMGNSDMMLVCSSSAGPAFEGSQMTSGMLASDGAVDSVSICDGKVSFTVIGGVAAKGICGSGIIDLIAELFRNGMLDRRGNFTEKADVSEGVFSLAEGVVITQSEIHDIIMTKAAIYSAARTLVRTLGLGFSDISRVCIAGGFGNFIDMDSAVTIGLFPDIPRSRYVYMGNASLAGARRALLSDTFRQRVADVFQRITYVDLSSDPLFYDEYMSAQFLPHTDSSQFPSNRF